MPFSMRDYQTKKFRCAEEAFMTIVLNEASLLSDYLFDILVPLDEQQETFPKRVPDNVNFINREYQHIKEERDEPIPIEFEIDRYDLIITFEPYNYKRLFGGYEDHTIAFVTYIDYDRIDMLQKAVENIKLVIFLNKEAQSLVQCNSILFEIGINPAFYALPTLTQRPLVIIPTRISDDARNRTQEAIEFVEANFQDYEKVLLNPNDVEFVREGWTVGPFSKEQYFAYLTQAAFIVNFVDMLHGNVGIAEQLLLSKANVITYDKKYYDSVFTKDDYRTGSTDLQRVRAHLQYDLNLRTEQLRFLFNNVSR